MPDEYAAHRRLSEKLVGMGISAHFATGEHEYTRWGYNQLIDHGVDLLQPDVMWMGGVTEFARVVALASSRGVAVVPHGCGVYGYYMCMAFPSIPLAEFMIMSEQADSIDPNFGSMFHSEPLPVDGYITLSTEPGFGLVLNKAALNLQRPFLHTVPALIVAKSNGASGEEAAGGKRRKLKGV